MRHCFTGGIVASARHGEGAAQQAMRKGRRGAGSDQHADPVSLVAKRAETLPVLRSPAIAARYRTIRIAFERAVPFLPGAQPSCTP